MRFVDRGDRTIEEPPKLIRIVVTFDAPKFAPAVHHDERWRIADLRDRAQFRRPRSEDVDAAQRQAFRLVGQKVDR